MSRRLSQVISIVFIVMVVLPCSAPFPTCGLDDWLRSGAQQTTPPIPSSSSTPFADREYLYAPPLATAPGRLRIVVAEPGAAPMFLQPLISEPAIIAETGGVLPPLPERQRILRH